MTGEPQLEAAGLAATLRSDRGTVTEFLEHLAGEPIDADIVSQHTGPADHGDIGLPPDRELVRRAVLLTGRMTRRRFVYAESAIAGPASPAGAQPPGGQHRSDRASPERPPTSDPAGRSRRSGRSLPPTAANAAAAKQKERELVAGMCETARKQYQDCSAMAAAAKANILSQASNEYQRRALERTWSVGHCEDMKYSMWKMGVPLKAPGK